MLIIAALLVRLAAPVPQTSTVPSSPESIANGGKSFSRDCATCHGATGQGNGTGGAKLSPKPSNLTDEDWKHGSTDADIFTVIHDGVKNTGMKGYASRMTEREIWDV